MDRGPSVRNIITLTQKLSLEAALAGGEVRSNPCRLPIVHDNLISS